jgi:hypothetical protein
VVVLAEPDLPEEVIQEGGGQQVIPREVVAAYLGQQGAAVVKELAGVGVVAAGRGQVAQGCQHGGVHQHAQLLAHLAVQRQRLLQQLRQPRFTIRRRRLDVDQPRQPHRQLILILQPGDLLARCDPAVTLPVDTHEHLALRQVGPVHRPRRMRPGAQLEHHRHQPQRGHRVPHRLTLGSQLTQRRTHEHPNPLIGRADHIWLGHRPQATAQQRRREDHARRAATGRQGAAVPGDAEPPRDTHRTASSSRQD